jgi:hypothetical protein
VADEDISLSTDIARDARTDVYYHLAMCRLVSEVLVCYPDATRAKILELAGRAFEEVSRMVVATTKNRTEEVTDEGH